MNQNLHTHKTPLRKTLIAPLNNESGILTIEYQPLTSSEQTTYLISGVVLFVNGILSTAGLLWLSNYILEALNPVLTLFAALLCLGYIIISFICALALGGSLTRPVQTLTLTSSGLIFPFAANVPLRGRRWRQWSEIKSYRLNWQEDKALTENDNLLLEFRDGCKLSMALNSMSPSALEQLLIAIEMGTAGMNLNCNSNKGLRNYLATQLQENGAPSYTTLWNDELSRRFSLTTFRPLAPGAKLQEGRYEITAQLKFGGFSAVYNAIGRKGEKVIVKELALSQIKNEKARLTLTEHINREAAMLAKLDHPQICRLLDTFVENGRHFLILEKIPGSTLRQLVNTNKIFTEGEVRKLALQMLNILRYLHHREPPLIHRDFTPDNLILKENGNLILIDFNAATELLSDVTHTIIGKHHYMPPEQIKGKAGKKSDYYAMAGTMAFLLTGKDPVPLLAIDLNEQTPCISSELNTLLLRLTNMDAAQRPDLEEIIETLNNLR